MSHTDGLARHTGMPCMGRVESTPVDVRRHKIEIEKISSKGLFRSPRLVCMCVNELERFALVRSSGGSACRAARSLADDDCSCGAIAVVLLSSSASAGPPPARVIEIRLKSAGPIWGPLPSSNSSRMHIHPISALTDRVVPSSSSFTRAQDEGGRGRF